MFAIRKELTRIKHKKSDTAGQASRKYRILFARYPVESDQKIWREHYIMEKCVTEIQFWRKFANVAGNNM